MKYNRDLSSVKKYTGITELEVIETKPEMEGGNRPEVKEEE